MKEERVLVLYVPAFHKGYQKLFEDLSSTVKALYLLGPELTGLFPVLEREIRQVEPETMAMAIRGLGLFQEVRVATIKDLEKLAQEQTPLLLSDERISEGLQKRYFSQNNVRKVSVFLRWDENYVKQSQGEAKYDARITSDHFHKDVLQKASLEAEHSSDWFRRVGAALVIDDAIRIVTHNARMPSPHEVWAVGDPRMYIDYGSDLHLRATVHAEEGLIVQAAKEGIPTEGAWIYSTVFPCAACANMIALSGITRCYFKEGYAALQGDDVLKAFGVEVIQVVD